MSYFKPKSRLEKLTLDLVASSSNLSRSTSHTLPFFTFLKLAINEKNKGTYYEKQKWRRQIDEDKENQRKNKKKARKSKIEV